MEFKNPEGQLIAIPGDYIVWKKKEFDVWFNFSRGQISSGYTRKDGLRKLKQIALYLKAGVVGDEGEKY